MIGGENTWKWIIDPLDGTTNFAHGYPCFCVTLALEHDGEIVIGVTFDPTRNELFSAERGHGASLNNKPIRVSETEQLSEALIVTGFPYDFKRQSNFARNLTEFLLNSRGVRRDGSAAIDMAYVACGRFDGFWEEGLNPWDMAAGVLLIEEAGGQVTRLRQYEIQYLPAARAGEQRPHSFPDDGRPQLNAEGMGLSVATPKLTAPKPAVDLK